MCEDNKFSFFKKRIHELTIAIRNFYTVRVLLKQNIF